MSPKYSLFGTYYQIKIEKNGVSWNETTCSVFDNWGKIGDRQNQEIILEYFGYFWILTSVK